MSAFTKAIPEALRTFVKPQIDQLSIPMKSIRCGMYGTIPHELGEGFLWTAPLGNTCLISMHVLKLAHTMPLEEKPTDYSCVFSGSRATVLSSPELKIPAPLERENLAVFSQKGGTSTCLLEANSLYESTSITFTPEFFDDLKTSYSDDIKALAEYLESSKSCLPPHEVRLLLRSINPQRACLPGASLYFQGKILEIIGYLSALDCAGDFLEESSSENIKYQPQNLMIQGYHKGQDRYLVQQAQAYIQNHISQHLTTEIIAESIYTSRSHLCKIFKETLGIGVAEYVRKTRINSACILLKDQDISINEVATRVGYARTSAFSEAFHQATKMSPSEWRNNFAS